MVHIITLLLNDNNNNNKKKKKKNNNNSNNNNNNNNNNKKHKNNDNKHNEDIQRQKSTESKRQQKTRVSKSQKPTEGKKNSNASQKKHRPKAEKHDRQKTKSGPGAQDHVMPLICFSMARPTLHFSYPAPRTFCGMASWWCWRLFEDSNHSHNLTNPSWWRCNCRTAISPAHLTNAPEPGNRQTPPTDRTLAEHKKHTVLNQYSISLLFHLYVC